MTSDGVWEWWSGGVLECWRPSTAARGRHSAVFQHSNTPTLRPVATEKGANHTPAEAKSNAVVLLRF